MNHEASSEPNFIQTISKSCIVASVELKAAVGTFYSWDHEHVTSEKKPLKETKYLTADLLCLTARDKRTGCVRVCLYHLEFKKEDDHKNKPGAKGTAEGIFLTEDKQRNKQRGQRWKEKKQRTPAVYLLQKIQLLASKLLVMNPSLF